MRGYAQQFAGEPEPRNSDVLASAVQDTAAEHAEVDEQGTGQEAGDDGGADDGEHPADPAGVPFRVIVQFPSRS